LLLFSLFPLCGTCCRHFGPFFKLNISLYLFSHLVVADSTMVWLRPHSRCSQDGLTRPYIHCERRPPPRLTPMRRRLGDATCGPTCAPGCPPKPYPLPVPLHTHSLSPPQVTFFPPPYLRHRPIAFRAELRGSNSLQPRGPMYSPGPADRLSTYLLPIGPVRVPIPPVGRMPYTFRTVHSLPDLLYTENCLSPRFLPVFFI
jgi:hypothetical protein